jgi:hypothetical protein
MKKVFFAIIAVFFLVNNQAAAQEKALIRDKKTVTILYNWKGKTCADFDAWVNSIPPADAAYWRNDIVCTENTITLKFHSCIVDYINKNGVNGFAGMQVLIKDQKDLDGKQIAIKYCTAAESLQPDKGAKLKSKN